MGLLHPAPKKDIHIHFPKCKLDRVICVIWRPHMPYRIWNPSAWCSVWLHMQPFPGQAQVLSSLPMHLLCLCVCLVRMRVILQLVHFLSVETSLVSASPPPHPPQAIDGQSQRSQIPFHIPLAQLPSTVLSVIGDWPTSLTRCILGGHDAFWVGTACGNSCLSSENEEWFILQSLYMIHVYISHTYIYVCVYLLCIHLLYVDVFLSFPEPKILIIFKNIFTDWFTPVLISISFPEAILLRSSEKS